MRKILLGIIVLNLMVNCSLVYAEPDEFVLTQKKSDDKSFLEVFTEEEQCIILSFEHQLDIFGFYYKYHHRAMVETAGDIELWDVASLYWNSSAKTLDGFLEYIVAPSRKFTTNIEYNEEAFKDKVWKDYEFVKKTRIKEREKELKKELERQKDDEFFNFVYKIYTELMNSSKGREYFKRIKGKLDD